MDTTEIKQILRRVVAIGRREQGRRQRWDGTECGAMVLSPEIFDTLAALGKRRRYYTLADGLDILAGVSVSLCPCVYTTRWRTFCVRGFLYPWPSPCGVIGTPVRDTSFAALCVCKMFPLRDACFLGGWNNGEAHFFTETRQQWSWGRVREFLRATAHGRRVRATVNYVRDVALNGVNGFCILDSTKIILNVGGKVIIWGNMLPPKNIPRKQHRDASSPFLYAWRSGMGD